MSETVTDDISDGYHTFGELYSHRAALFIAVMKMRPKISWYATCHNDGTDVPGFFIGGMQLPQGQISYHMCFDPWLELVQRGPTRVPYYINAPKWDGHTPQMSLDRLIKWIETM